MILSSILALPVVIAILSVQNQANAHGDIHARIALLDKRIATTPDNYNLYLKRAELHRFHAEWSSALTDYHRAQALHPHPVDIEFFMGRMLLEAGQPGKALIHMQRFLREHPDSTSALLVRARVKEALGQRANAADDLAHVIRSTRQPPPELYIEWADLVISGGDKHLDEGMRIIEEGIGRLGPVVSMIQYAVVVETAHNRYQKALQWVDSLPEKLQAQPRWLAKRGDILSAAGQYGEARKVYGEAISTLEHNPSRRKTLANDDLAAELRMKVSALDRQRDETS
jgi:predicted Zn-dependent protease